MLDATLRKAKGDPALFRRLISDIVSGCSVDLVSIRLGRLLDSAIGARPRESFVKRLIIK